MITFWFDIDVASTGVLENPLEGELVVPLAPEQAAPVTLTGDGGFWNTEGCNKGLKHNAFISLKCSLSCDQ